MDPTANDSIYHNTNGVPRLNNGATIHLGVCPGQVANRVLSVGSSKRAMKLAQHFDPQEKSIRIDSDRGFVIYTGKVDGVPVSIVATGMGIANMDFVVRETRAVVEGKMAIVRYGTCGSINKSVPCGTVAVSGKGSVFVSRNPDAFHADADAEEEHYKVSRPVLPDELLSSTVIDKLNIYLKDKYEVHNSMNATACTFYSSQGRIDDHFDDENRQVHQLVQKKQPEVATMEMETFQLLDLARCSHGTIAASAAVIVIASRWDGTVIEDKKLNELENIGGLAILKALCAYEL